MLIGHQKQWQFLKKSAELGKISHAYLFSGSEKIGKKKIALEWANVLMRQKGEHFSPDLILITPEEREIKISQIRDLIWKLSLKPYSAFLKVAIINEAHLMNKDSQNCFLKTLEEPKDNTLLILITEYPETLLPTILSRCQIIKFYPVPQKEIEDYLKKEETKEEKIKEILKISQGRPGVAIDFLSNSEKLDDWQKSLKVLKEILKSDIADRFEYAKELSQKDNLKEILEVWLGYFRSILLSCFVQDSSYFIQDLNHRKISEIHHDNNLDKLKNILKKIQNIIFLISTTNVNQRLALEILMLEF